MRFFTPDELVTIYQQVGGGKDVKHLAKQLKSGPTQVKHAYARMFEYLNGRPFNSYSAQSYKEAVRLISQYTQKESSYGKTISANVESYLKSIEDCQKQLDQAVLNFIDYMVDKKAGEFMAQNEILRKENKELKKVVEVAKESNIVTNLRRHFGWEA